jgi:hypothetical protein
MNIPIISIAGRSGGIFEGELPETVCFVPRECITGEGEEIRLAEIEYVCDGWDVRNMRFNADADGNHLFPDVRRPVKDLGSERVRVFLDRLRIVRPA